MRSCCCAFCQRPVSRGERCNFIRSGGIGFFGPLPKNFRAFLRASGGQTAIPRAGSPQLSERRANRAFALAAAATSIFQKVFRDPILLGKAALTICRRFLSPKMGRDG